MRARLREHVGETSSTGQNFRSTHFRVTASGEESARLLRDDLRDRLDTFPRLVDGMLQIPDGLIEVIARAG